MRIIIRTPAEFDESFKVTSVTYFITDFNKLRVTYFYI